MDPVEDFIHDDSKYRFWEGPLSLPPTEVTLSSDTGSSTNKLFHVRLLYKETRPVTLI